MSVRTNDRQGYYHSPETCRRRSEPEILALKVNTQNHVVCHVLMWNSFSTCFRKEQFFQTILLLAVLRNIICAWMIFCINTISQRHINVREDPLLFLLYCFFWPSFILFFPYKPEIFHLVHHSVVWTINLFSLPSMVGTANIV